jgi:phospholipid/cholesterol/gamma-HCH transport system substrate-binding protein
MATMRRLKIVAVAAAAAVGLSGCGFSPYDLPLPGGADTGDNPYVVTAEFRDVLDLVPQSGVRVNDIAVGKVTDIELDGWIAKVTLEINGDAKLPDNALATIRQTSLLGEKFVSLAPPKTGAVGELGDGDNIPLSRSGRNPELEEVLSAASLLFNGGGLERTNTIVTELSKTLEGNEPEIKELLDTTTSFLGQLDANKEALLTSLEKVNRLAVTTDDQSDAITGALDDLPDALRVVNDQRDDLVGLLQALNRLGDVATGVIRESKEDTIADLKLLTPTLTQLAVSADDLAFDFQALLSYPFTDGTIGQGAQLDGTRPAGQPSAVKGDFANLSIRLDIDQQQLAELLSLLGLDGLEKLLDPLGLGGLLDGLIGDTTPEAAPESESTPDDASGATPEVEELQRAIEGLRLPGTGGLLKSPDQPSPSSSTPSPTRSASPGAGSGSRSDGRSGSGGVVCGLLGMCRTSPFSGSDSVGLAAVLLQPAVTR